MGIRERKQREKERRRKQIMVAAKRVFIKNGYGRATMESIAKEAELSAGFQSGIRKGICLDRHPMAIADIVWSMFSGLVLWEASKVGSGQDIDHLKPTLKTAFEIFEKGIFVAKEGAV
jgi:AcrR family transcriptional regulator